MWPPQTLGQLIVITPLKHAQNMEVLNMWQYTAGTYQLLYYIQKKNNKKTTYLPTLYFLDPLPETQIFFFWPYLKVVLSWKTKHVKMIFHKKNYLKPEITGHKCIEDERDQI